MNAAVIESANLLNAVPDLMSGVSPKCKMLHPAPTVVDRRKPSLAMFRTAQSQVFLTKPRQKLRHVYCKRWRTRDRVIVAAGSEDNFAGALGIGAAKMAQAALDPNAAGEILPRRLLELEVVVPNPSLAELLAARYA